MGKILTLIDERRVETDEGIYNFAYNLGQANGWSFIAKNIKHKFLPLSFIKTVRKYNPDFIIYIPTASLTIVSFIRAKLIKKLTEKNIAIIGLQPRKYNKFIKRLLMLNIFKPDVLFVQILKEYKFFRRIGFRVYMIPSGVNLKKFKPVSREKKIALREKYGISKKDFVVLHIGPLRKSRNIDIFEQLTDKYKVLLVGSTSLPQDKNIKNRIISNGGIVIDRFFPNIEEIYQLSDLYLFPVQEEGAAISFPLTILEAMACNLPVISTQFGVLPYFLKEEKGFIWMNTTEEILEKINKVRQMKKINTRKIAEQFSWGEVGKKLENAIY